MSILSSGPVGFWALNEATGTTAQDQGSAANNGTLAGGVTLGQSGPWDVPGTAMLFNGTDSRVQAPHHTAYDFGTGAMSVELWYKTTFTASLKVLIDNKTIGSDNPGFNVFMNDVGAGRLSFRVGYTTSQNQVSASTNTADGAWHHVVGVFDRTANPDDTLRIYQDGVDTGTTFPVTAARNITSTEVLDIGRRTGADDFSFPGSLANVALFNRALTATEIFDHYTQRAASLAGRGPFPKRPWLVR